MFKIKISSFDLLTIKRVDLLIKKLNLSYVVMPKKVRKIVVLKSPHVNSKAKEHFALARYRRLCFSSKKSIIRELILCLPHSVSLKIEYSGNSAAW